jgi:hypothetical protein
MGSADLLGNVVRVEETSNSSTLLYYDNGYDCSYSSKKYIVEVTSTNEGLKYRRLTCPYAIYRVNANGSLGTRIGYLFEHELEYELKHWGSEDKDIDEWVGEWVERLYGGDIFMSESMICICKTI